jgi:hypothetical protein
MIDLSTESILSLRDAAKLLPSARRGRPVSFACLWRWALRGTRSPDGHTVKLEALRLGGRWVTSREALQRFAEALTPQARGTPPPSRSTKQRQKAAEKAAAALERIGL